MSAAGTVADPWQATLLRSASKRILVLNSRQAGKSSVAAALALKTALLMPGSLTLLLAPTERQSGELLKKCYATYRKLGRPVPAARENALSLELASGSRIIALPGDEEGIRGYSAPALVVLDEASRVSDALYAAVRPMLAVGKGTLIALTTPFGKRGWFFDAWAGKGTWERVRVTAEQCPRISAEFLAEERQALGERWFRQEYFCEFVETADNVFGHVEIMKALTGDVRPLFRRPS
jgi:hypothetical protein